MFPRIPQAILGAMLLACAFVTSPSKVQGAEPSRDELLARIQSRDRAAMLEAGNTRDASYVPALQGFIDGRTRYVEDDATKLEKMDRDSGITNGISAEAEIAHELDDPSIHAAKAALAKLGVRKYLDETLTELTTTNSLLYRAERDRARGSTAGSAAEERVALYNTRKTALDKLAYIADPSTVRVIASCLADTVAPHPAPPGVTSRVFRTSVAQLAGKALRRIVSNPPPSDDVQVWQQWWEQNKDKYP